MLTISCSGNDIRDQVYCSLYVSRMTGTDGDSALLVDIVNTVHDGHFNLCKVSKCACVSVCACMLICVVGMPD